LLLLLALHQQLPLQPPQLQLRRTLLPHQPPLLLPLPHLPQQPLHALPARPTLHPYCRRVLLVRFVLGTDIRTAGLAGASTAAAAAGNALSPACFGGCR
jgi:hypothetical protein